MLQVPKAANAMSFRMFSQQRAGGHPGSRGGSPMPPIHKPTDDEDSNDDDDSEDNVDTIKSKLPAGARLADHVKLNVIKPQQENAIEKSVDQPISNMPKPSAQLHSPPGYQPKGGIRFSGFSEREVSPKKSNFPSTDVQQGSSRIQGIGVIGPDNKAVIMRPDDPNRGKMLENTK